MNVTQAKDLLDDHSTEQLRTIIKHLSFLYKLNTPAERVLLSAARTLLELRGER